MNNKLSVPTGPVLGTPSDIDRDAQRDCQQDTQRPCSTHTDARSAAAAAGWDGRVLGGKFWASSYPRASAGAAARSGFLVIRGRQLDVSLDHFLFEDI